MDLQNYETKERNENAALFGVLEMELPPARFQQVSALQKVAVGMRTSEQDIMDWEWG